MITLTGGKIQGPGGVIVQNGYISFGLQVDSTVIATPAIVVSTIPVEFRFDGSGNLLGSCKIYSNIELTPQSGYTVNLYDANHSLVNADPMTWVFGQVSGSTVDIGTMISTGPAGPSYAANPITLQTNTVNNGSQTKLNLKNGGGIVQTDDGSGGVTTALANVSGVTTKFFSSVTGNALTLTQPAFTDISGVIAAGQIPSRTGSIDFVIDGAGLVPTTGAKGQISIPVACTVSQWILTADQSGSAVIDVLRSTYAGFPTTASIAGTDKPTLSAVQKNRNTGPLASWGSTALVAGDELQINLNSVTTCTRLNLTLVLSVPWS